jgi:dihydroflavonol-4-reductase
MRVLVLGGTGHLGNAVVRALLERRFEVSATGRRGAPPANLVGLPVHYMPGDADIAGQFDKWIAGHDLVIDAAAPYPLTAFFPPAKAAGNPIFEAEKRTRRLLDSLYRHNARLAYISTCSTLARSRTSERRFELQMMRLTHLYLEVKELIESQVLDAARHGLRAVIVNPTYCLGPWDIRAPQLCVIPMLLRGNVPVTTSQMLNVIDVRDMAAALLAAVSAERYGERILLSAYNISNRDLYSTICELGGVPKPQASIPPSVAFGGSFLAEAALAIVGVGTTDLSGMIMLASSFDYLPHLTAIEALGIQPRPLSATITDAIRWYRQIGYC